MTPEEVSQQSKFKVMTKVWTWDTGKETNSRVSEQQEIADGLELEKGAEWGL